MDLMMVKTTQNMFNKTIFIIEKLFTKLKCKHYCLLTLVQKKQQTARPVVFAKVSNVIYEYGLKSKYKNKVNPFLRRFKFKFLKVTFLIGNFQKKRQPNCQNTDDLNTYLDSIQSE